MRKIVAATPEHLAILCKEVEYVPGTNMKGVTLLVDGEPVVVVGCDGWTEGAVAIHQWIKSPQYMGKDIIREVFNYVFVQADRRVALGLVRGDNARALRFNRKLGFEPAAVIEDGYGPGVPMHILQLRRDKCRWIQPK